MEEYKAYLLGPDGRVASRVDPVCEDEKAARDHAKKLAQDCIVELWHGATKIATFQPRD